jgi:hypothetical protein
MKVAIVTVNAIGQGLSAYLRAGTGWPPAGAALT